MDKKGEKDGVSIRRGSSRHRRIPRTKPVCFGGRIRTTSRRSKPSGHHQLQSASRRPLPRFVEECSGVRSRRRASRGRCRWQATRSKLATGRAGAFRHRQTGVRRAGSAPKTVLVLLPLGAFAAHAISHPTMFRVGRFCDLASRDM